jgi:hypothetical protein
MATLPLKNIPVDVKKYILKLQGEIKAKKGTQYSQEQTIFTIIRQHQEFSEKK